MSTIHHERRREVGPTAKAATLLAALVVAGLLLASTSTARAQEAPDCPEEQIINGFARPEFSEQHPDCIERVVAEGPDKLYGLDLPERFGMRPIHDGGAVAPHITYVTYVVDRPPGDPLGPSVIAVSVERSTSPWAVSGSTWQTTRCRCGCGYRDWAKMWSSASSTI